MMFDHIHKITKINRYKYFVLTKLITFVMHIFFFYIVYASMKKNVYIYILRYHLYLHEIYSLVHNLKEHNQKSQTNKTKLYSALLFSTDK